ncbi:MAG TPA: CheR family methyltransferase, partial [Cellvibrionaceae bacterium]|nr:CheR family methyltransferase [Cellvibrionaceae bacterium]
SFYLLGKFDVIFCRNVLIYFSQELKTEILRKLHGQLHPGGFLFLGSSEGLTGVAELFEMVDCAPGLAYKAI